MYRVFLRWMNNLEDCPYLFSSIMIDCTCLQMYVWNGMQQGCDLTTSLRVWMFLNTSFYFIVSVVSETVWIDFIYYIKYMRFLLLFFYFYHVSSRVFLRWMNNLEDCPYLFSSIMIDCTCLQMYVWNGIDCTCLQMYVWNGMQQEMDLRKSCNVWKWNGVRNGFKKIKNIWLKPPPKLCCYVCFYGNKLIHCRLSEIQHFFERRSPPMFHAEKMHLRMAWLLTSAILELTQQLLTSLFHAISNNTEILRITSRLPGITSQTFLSWWCCTLHQNLLPSNGWCGGCSGNMLLSYSCCDYCNGTLFLTDAWCAGHAGILLHSNGGCDAHDRNLLLSCSWWCGDWLLCGSWCGPSLGNILTDAVDGFATLLAGFLSICIQLLVLWVELCCKIHFQHMTSHCKKQHAKITCDVELFHNNVMHMQIKQFLFTNCFAWSIKWEWWHLCFKCGPCFMSSAGELLSVIQVFYDPRSIWSSQWLVWSASQFNW